MSGMDERRKSARQRVVKPTKHSAALEHLRAVRGGNESRAEQYEVSERDTEATIVCTGMQYKS